VAVHIYTKTIHRTTQITTNVEECGACPVFASFTLAFALKLRKMHGKTSVRIRKASVRLRRTSEYSIHITKTPTHYKTHTHTHTHTLQNNIKPPQYKLKHITDLVWERDRNGTRDLTDKFRHVCGVGQRKKKDLHSDIYKTRCGREIETGHLI
jgi:hypothetical protein